MQNEAKTVHDESHTKVEEEEEMSQLHAKEPHNLDTKVDDITHGAEIHTINFLGKLARGKVLRFFP
jgi:hypothetical protein